MSTMACPLHGQQVLVLGLGESGLAMARWCARQGATVSVWDSRETPPQLGELRQSLPEAAVRSGDLTAEALQGVQRVLKSPGLSPHDPRIEPLLQAAHQQDVPVQGELDLFVQALEQLRAERDYAPQVLAVTGTNGKTTTTALAALLVERAGRSAVAAGNISPTMLDTLMQRLDDDSLPQVWVLELSSFQLDGVFGFEPHAAAVLNLTQDHLDWHGDMAAYGAAKARIFGERTVAVVNRDDPVVDAMASAPLPVPLPKPGAKPARPRAPKPVQRTTVRFGLDVPAHPGDFGLVTEGGMAWLVRAMPDEPGTRRKKDEPAEIHLQRLMPADALRVRGRHNAANALAALALATAIGCPLAPMLHGLREYGGEPHRVQPVCRVGDVEAFDDSKGTNVGATVAALVGLGADKAPARLAVILGGDGKGQDFSPLAEPVARHARAVALIGRDADRIEAALAAIDLPMQRHADLPSAVRWCFEQARPGDAVLLSPACASLDMFRNYGHRAEVFVQAVHALAAERGEIDA
ncbi:MAG TPA: UDP-N-acetylmuramoyl-L-alanine--D-glutamate ligase [Burkholderiaceae bacterium]|nr:UDP-N-acetylmuramoyl-L-alanine--D-glutamate ligase [Burkholderiaceae bacterium]